MEVAVISPGSFSSIDASGSPESYIRYLDEVESIAYVDEIRELTYRPLAGCRRREAQLEHEMRAVRSTMRTARAELPALKVAPQVIEQTIRLYAAELSQLHHLSRGVREVMRALLDTKPTDPARPEGSA